VPAFDGPLVVRDEHVLYEWIASTLEPGRREALLTWFAMVCKDPDDLITGALASPTKPGRRAYYSDVPGAFTRVTFVLREFPVPSIWLVNIDDGSFQAT